MRNDDLDFLDAVARARVIERMVSEWLQARGWLILPVYDYSGLAENKAPKLLSKKLSLVTPDLLGARNGESRWVEVKWKSRADFTRMSQRMETGVDARLWNNYLLVQKETGIPVWIAFVHELENEIRAEHIDILARSARHGDPQRKMSRSGMVFFAWDSLRFLARLSDVRGNLAACAARGAP